MKVLLINISLRPDSQNLLPPVGLAYIATAIKNAGYELDLLDIDANRYSDEEVENYIKENDFDIVAFGCIVTSYSKVKQLADMIKRNKNVPIMVGNSVASSIPDILLSKTEVDIAIFGEGDITDVEVLRAIEKGTDLSTVEGIAFKKDGKITKTAQRKAIENLDDLPFIDWSIFDVEKYIQRSKYFINEPYPVPYDEIRSLPINTARGCIFRCTFCYHVFRNDKYRIRSYKNICEEMKLLKEKYNVNYVFLFDELTFYSVKQCEEFINVYQEYNLDVYWNASIRANLFKEKDIEILQRFKDIGCIGLSYSLESGSEDILTAMDKKITVLDFVQQTKVLKKVGLEVWTSIVIGYPQETSKTIQETFDVLYDAEVYPSVGYLIPLPGTPMYDYALKEGIISDEEEYLLNMGDRQDFRINLTKMKKEEIEQCVVKNLKRISDKLNLALDQSRLIKTGHYKSSKSN